MRRLVRHLTNFQTKVTEAVRFISQSVGEQRQPATPPASEPSRDAVIEAAKAFGLDLYGTTAVALDTFQDRIVDFVLKQLAHFAGQRAEAAGYSAEVVKEANDRGYEAGQRSERERLRKAVEAMESFSGDIIDRADVLELIGEMK